jgi:hypothetical protein
MLENAVKCCLQRCPLRAELLRPTTEAYSLQFSSYSFVNFRFRPMS